MHANGFAHIDTRVSDSARDAVRGNGTAARSQVNAIEARLDSFYEGLSANGDGDLDLSGVSSDFGTNAEQKVQAYVELASKLHGANAALNELDAIAMQLQRPPIERVIANGGMAPAPQLSDIVARTNGGRLGFNPDAHTIVPIPALPVATLFKTTAGYPPLNQRTGYVEDATMAPLDVLSAMRIETTTQNAVAYMRQTVTAAAAVEKAEGAAAAEADISYAPDSSNVVKIPVILPVTDEQLADEPGVRSLLDNDLIELVRQRVNRQIAVGNGSAPNLQGFAHNKVAATNAGIGISGAASPTGIIDACIDAVRKVRTAGKARASHVMLNSSLYTALLKSKDTQMRYLMGDPNTPLAPAVWGVPIVEADDIADPTANNGYWGCAGAFSTKAAFYLRQDATVEAGLVNDDFAKGQITLRCTLRGVMVWYRNAAFVGLLRAA